MLSCNTREIIRLKVSSSDLLAIITRLYDKFTPVISSNYHDFHSVTSRHLSNQKLHNDFAYLTLKN